jgi:hypothetical protein
MVQIKTTAVALVAAAVIAPAVASSFYYPEDGLVTREDFDEYNEVLARDYDFDLEEREYDDELFEREFDDSEMFEREFDNSELYERDYDAEIDARAFDEEMMEVNKRQLAAEYEELLQRYFNDLYDRELTAEAEADLAAREFETEEFDLVQRSPEPGIIEWFKNLFHPKKKEDQKKKKADSKTAASSSDTKKTDASTSDSKTADSSASDKKDDSAAAAPADSSVDARGYYEDFDELD